MTADLTDPAPPTSRPTLGVIRARFQDKQDKTIDEAMGQSESWAKKIRNNQQGVLLDNIPKLLAVLGLKVVDAARICITKEELDTFEAYKTIARNHLSPQPRLDQDFDK